MFNIAGSWEQPSHDSENIAWVRSAWEELRQFSTGSTYVNFLTEEETGAKVREVYAGHHQRLTEIKGKWDPANQFRLNKNIPPGRA